MNIAQIKSQLQASKFEKLVNEYNSLSLRTFDKGLEMAILAKRAKIYYFQAKKELKKLGIENLGDFAKQILSIERQWLDKLVTIAENLDRVESYKQAEKSPSLSGFLSFLRPKKEPEATEPEATEPTEPAESAGTEAADKATTVSIKVVVTINGTSTTIDVPENSKLFSQIMREVSKTAN